MTVSELIKKNPQYKIVQCDVNTQVTVLIIIDTKGNGMMIGSTDKDHFEQCAYKALTVGAPSVNQVKDILRKFTE